MIANPRSAHTLARVIYVGLGRFAGIGSSPASRRVLTKRKPSSGRRRLPISCAFTGRCVMSTLPPFVPKRVVGAANKDVDPVGSPGDRARSRAQHTTPRTPRRSRPSRSTICATARCRCHEQTRRGDCAQDDTVGSELSAPPRAPAAPGRAVPPFVPQRVVGATNKDIDPVGPPGNRARSGARHAAQRTPRRSRPSRSTICAKARCTSATNKQSRRFASQDDTVGSEVRPAQRFPSRSRPSRSTICAKARCWYHERRHRSGWAPRKPAPGPELSTPPRDSQPLQAEPFHHLCQSALSVPRTNTSRRFAAQDDTVGSEVSTPPREDSQPLQPERG